MTMQLPFFSTMATLVALVTLAIPADVASTVKTAAADTSYAGAHAAGDVTGVTDTGAKQTSQSAGHVIRDAEKRVGIRVVESRRTPG